MTYRYLDDETIADVAFEVEALDLKSLFEQAGQAVTNVMVRDLTTIREDKDGVDFALDAPDVETLLYRFLSEVVYLKDADNFLCARFGGLIIGEGFTARDGSGRRDWHLDCAARGERVDQARHNLIVDVKAVTWHRFKVWEEGGKWKAFVILDI